MAKRKSHSKAIHSGGLNQVMGELSQFLGQLSEGELEHILSGTAPQSIRIADKAIRRHSPSADTPAEHARLLVEQAYGAKSNDRAVALALEALQHDVQCVEAHQMLGDLSRTADEACQSYRDAMESAEAKLGPKEFNRCKGEFWGWVETRPYMRARQALADSLWAAGKRDEAFGHYEAMLELNPNDNQGIRHVLAVHYLNAKRTDALAKLLDTYPDDMAPEFVYTRALLEFRRSGDSVGARSALKAAFDVNRHVPDFLLGEKRLPSQPPEMIQRGGKDEAVSYVFFASGNWTSTPEALAWLRIVLSDLRKGASPKRTKKLPLSAALQKKLLAAPLTDEVWQVGTIQLSDDTAADDVRVVIVVSCDGDLPLNLQPAEDDWVRAIWKTVCASIVEPADERRRRPVCVEMAEEYAAALRESLQRIGVEVRASTNLDAVARCREQLLGSAAGGFLRSSENLRVPEMAELLDLPQNDDIWQVDLRALPLWMEHDGSVRRPWSVVVVEADGNGVLNQSFDVEQPMLDKLWDVVASAMVRPLIGKPLRPAQIEVTGDEWARFLRPRCEPLGIEVEIVAELPTLEKYLADLRDRDPASVEIEARAVTAVTGVTAVALAEFYDAAAMFFRAAPWRNTAIDQVWKVNRCDEPRGTWYALVMGQSGLEMGLALYERLDDIRALFDSRSSSQQLMRHMSCVSLMYSEAHHTAFSDLDAIEKNAWPIAAPEAYPTVIRITGRGALGLPSAAELSFIEGAIRALHVVGAKATTTTCDITVAGRPVQFEVSPAPL